MPDPADIVERLLDHWRDWGSPHEMASDCKEAAAEIERLRTLLEKEELAQDQLIQERDSAEDALSDMYQNTTGAEPQWSNHFGYHDAVREAQEAHESLRTELRLRKEECEAWRDGDFEYDITEIADLPHPKSLTVIGWQYRLHAARSACDAFDAANQKGSQ